MLSTAIEFFSGIGAFKAAALQMRIEVLAAYDQSDHANAVYRHNFGVRPRQRNLDTISGGDLPRADLWWLSPPCQPFSRRGKKADLDDARAQPLINLISLLPSVRPPYFALENVQGFAGSRAESLLADCLSGLGYSTKTVLVCPTQLGIPMQRPRLFYLGSLAGTIKDLPRLEAPPRRLSEFIDSNNSHNESLLLDPHLQKRYAASLNIVHPDDRQARTICFTSGYSRCMNCSGSFIALPGERLRYFSPEEILRLLGFPEAFSFPPEMATAVRLRLAGNSVDLRSIKLVLSLLLP